MPVITRPFVLLVFLTLFSCAARSGLQLVEYDKRLQQLEKEKEKLKKQTDPVGRTKTQIKISDILVTMISDTAKTGDMELMATRLDEYVSTIRNAHQTMANTGRDAHKKPKGFKELEIALRRQVRQLEDIGGALTYDQRESIEKARVQAAGIREELLRALFGEQNAPANKS